MAVPPRAFSLLESSRAEWWQVGVAEGFEMRRESLRGLLPTLGREGREGCKIIAEMAGRENSKSVRFGGLFHLNASGTSSPDKNITHRNRERHDNKCDLSISRAVDQDGVVLHHPQGQSKRKYGREAAR